MGPAVQYGGDCDLPTACLLGSLVNAFNIPRRLVGSALISLIFPRHHALAIIFSSIAMSVGSASTETVVRAGRMSAKYSA